MDVYHGCMENKVIIREYDGERDLEVVEKLERNCEIGSKRGFSIITNMMGDPLCRVRLYPVHVLLVAELVGDQRVVGVVRGSMKCVGTGLGAGRVRMGCILGLRVSPKHRRMGIGSKLVKSVEGWAIRNGAQYIFLASEESNAASINLFVHKFGYTKFSSLAILVELVDVHGNKHPPSHDVNIERLSVEQAISLYKDRLGGGALFPIDIDTILQEQLSLGTWVSYFKEERWGGLHCQEEDGEFLRNSPSSWAILSIWKTYESYKLQIRGAPLVGGLRTPPSSGRFSGSFGFLFLFGLHGEGARRGDLMRSLWCFASNMAGMVRDCKAVVAEFGAGDPLREHVQSVSSVSHIDDLWFSKRVGGGGGGYINHDDDLAASQLISNVFVDPRDF